MARIRTIKPEFPHSESMGRVSRDARLCFIELWTLADDSGRLRGASRMLASLLFPYDDDAAGLIDGWLSELEKEECIYRYEVDGAHYIQIRKWLEHQKIDKPSTSKIPPFDEHSRTFANIREHSSGDQGPRIKEGIKEGIKDQGRDVVPADAPPPPEIPDVCEMAVSRWNEFAEAFELATVQKLTKARKSKLTARLKSCGGLDGWELVLSKIGESAFLMGDNDRNWRADFDFILQEKSFTKLMEGAYDRSKPTNSDKQGWIGAALTVRGKAKDPTDVFG